MHTVRFAWVAAVMLTLVLGAATFVTAQEADAGEGDMVTPEAPAATAPATTGDAAPAQESLAITMLKAGGVIGGVIIALSVVTIALVVMSVVSLRRGRHLPVEVQEQVEQLFKQRKVKEALDLCREDGSLLARVVEAGLTKVRGGWPAMEGVMMDVAEEEGLRMQQQVGWFSLTAAISPMLGLLGTVWGMILVFYSIQKSGGITGVDAFASDIMKALVTTCLGLIVAIPNVWAYTAFRNKLDRIMMELSIVVGELMTPFKALKAAAAAPARPTQRPAAASVAAATAGKTPPATPEVKEESDEADEAEEKPEDKPEETDASADDASDDEAAADAEESEDAGEEEAAEDAEDDDKEADKSDDGWKSD